MQAPNLAQVADELYALAPTAFRTARDERAGQARAAGDADLADAIRKLRRPAVSAWLVNLLVREAPGQVDELLELGESLREAQHALAGDRLRDLSAQRRQLVRALSQEAKRLAAQAGQSLSGQVEREVQETLEASLADPDIADAVRSGRLTRALSYAGLGEGIGVGDAVAVWAAPAERPLRGSRPVAPSHVREPGKQAAAAKRETRQHPAAPQRPAGGAGAAMRGRREGETSGSDRREAGTAERDRVEAEAAERDRREAEAAERERRRAETAERDRREADEDAREARTVLDEAEREVTSANDQHQALLRRIEDLERQLAQLQAESAQDLRILRHAQRNRDVAARALDGALRRLARAQAKVSAIRGGGAP